jgi:Protein of unknown function (DUF3467)
MAEEDVDWSHLGTGEYANYFLVEHDFVAFYLDCGQLGNSEQKTKVYRRIIMTPVGARRLFDILRDALAEYKRRFGEIRDENGMIVSEGGEEKRE